MTLDRYTWDQAAAARLATALGFAALEIPAGTIRSWASQGLIAAVGKAPGGAHLYDIAAVSAVAARPRHQAGRKRGAAGLHNLAK